MCLNTNLHHKDTSPRQKTILEVIFQKKVKEPLLACPLHCKTGDLWDMILVEYQVPHFSHVCLVQSSFHVFVQCPVYLDSHVHLQILFIFSFSNVFLALSLVNIKTPFEDVFLCEAFFNHSFMLANVSHQPSIPLCIHCGCRCLTLCFLY